MIRYVALIKRMQAQGDYSSEILSDGITAVTWSVIEANLAVLCGSESLIQTLIYLSLIMCLANLATYPYHVFSTSLARHCKKVPQSMRRVSYGPSLRQHTFGPKSPDLENSRTEKAPERTVPVRETPYIPPEFRRPRYGYPPSEEPESVDRSMYSIPLPDHDNRSEHR